MMNNKPRTQVYEFDHPIVLEDKIRYAKVRISDAFEEFYPSIAIACSWGKDSMAIVALTRQLYPSIPVKAFFTDTGRKFPETYEYAGRMAKKFDLKVYTAKPEQPLLNCDDCRAWKVEAAREEPANLGFKALLVGIRHDEHEARANTPPLMAVNGVVRIHPILGWTEDDIWAFFELNKIPVHPLYKQGYRSLGCAPPCTVKTPADGAERSGRDQSKEEIMHRLRTDGYW